MPGARWRDARRWEASGRAIIRPLPRVSAPRGGLRTRESATQVQSAAIHTPRPGSHGRPVRLRPLLLPTEHGGWAFLVEPVIIALIAVPSKATLLLSLAALLVFLARQPLKLALDDRRRRRRVPRTRVALILGASVLLGAALALGGATVAATHRFWPAALLAAPLAAVHVWYDGRGEGRTLVAELAGAKALAAIACAAGLAAGLSWPYALSLWAAALARVLPAIVTVRERVQRLHGQRPDARGPAAAHLLALVGAAGLASVHVMPRGVVLVVVLLAVRAAWHLRPDAPSIPAVRLGLRELGTGLLAAAAIGGSYVLR
ncbi:MAG TPA: YwiC-like family protein [Vicinamibacterales bacterium]|nr:YwiC-like family protein [Vicinamibacterales bacterium]